MTLPNASRRIFISHSTYDTLTAKVMRDVLGRAGVGKTFLDADDLRPGDHWMPNIKTAIAECDAIITLLTPEFASRAWMSAEWACFWATDKTSYVLRLDVTQEKVFQPMQVSQAADLASVASMTVFLDAVAEDNVDNYRLAEALVKRVAQARAEQVLSHTQILMDALVMSRDAVHDDVIETLIATGHVEELTRLHERTDEPGANLSAVRLVQVARQLAGAAVSSERLVPLTRSIGNSNYQRDIVKMVLASPEPVAARRAFADSLFDALSIVGKQRVVTAAEELGLDLSDKWNNVPPFGT